MGSRKRKHCVLFDVKTRWLPLVRIESLPAKFAFCTVLFRLCRTCFSIAWILSDRNDTSIHGA